MFYWFSNCASNSEIVRYSVSGAIVVHSRRQQAASEMNFRSVGGFILVSSIVGPFGRNVCHFLRRDIRLRNSLAEFRVFCFSRFRDRCPRKSEAWAVDFEIPWATVLDSDIYNLSGRRHSDEMHQVMIRFTCAAVKYLNTILLLQKILHPSFGLLASVQGCMNNSLWRPSFQKSLSVCQDNQPL
jgi:hypothetical protein